MKRESILTILESEEDNETKLAKIMELNGKDINGRNAKIAELEGTVTDLRKESDERQRAIDEASEKYKGFDEMSAELEAMKKKESDRLFGERFNAVLGTNKPKNDFTRNGIAEAFRTAVLDEANKDKNDAQIFSEIVKGHESDYFEGDHKFTIVGAADDVKVDADEQTYLDSIYKDNPFYKG